MNCNHEWDDNKKKIKEENLCWTMTISCKNCDAVRKATTREAWIVENGEKRITWKYE